MGVGGKGQGGCEPRMLAIVKMQKIKNYEDAKKKKKKKTVRRVSGWL